MSPICTEIGIIRTKNNFKNKVSQVGFPLKKGDFPTHTRKSHPSFANYFENKTPHSGRIWYIIANMEVFFLLPQRSQGRSTTAKFNQSPVAGKLPLYLFCGLKYPHDPKTECCDGNGV